MINNALAVGGAHKLRFAQDLILYNLELSEQIEDFDGSAHKETWQEDPHWQATRENVERLTGVRDWAEAFFATAVVFEPLVGELFRSGLVMQAAALHGDYVTPSLMGNGESDVAREERGARALYAMLANDEKFGEGNRATMQGWLSDWTATSVEAAHQLQPIWSQLPEKVVRFEDSFGRSRERFESLLGDLGLDTPKELSA
jgi:propane 2-monooxygenase small subunit